MQFFEINETVGAPLVEDIYLNHSPQLSMDHHVEDHDLMEDETDVVTPSLTFKELSKGPAIGLRWGVGHSLHMFSTKRGDRSVYEQKNPKGSVRTFFVVSPTLTFTFFVTFRLLLIYISNYCACCTSLCSVITILITVAFNQGEIITLQWERASASMRKVR